MCRKELDQRINLQVCSDDQDVSIIKRLENYNIFTHFFFQYLRKYIELCDSTGSFFFWW